MQSIADAILTAEVLVTWHGWLKVIAVLLLAGLAVFALLQFSVARPGSTLARFGTRYSLRSRLTIGLVFAGTIPAVAVIMLLTERSGQMRLERLSGRLEETSVSMGNL